MPWLLVSYFWCSKLPQPLRFESTQFIRVCRSEVSLSINGAAFLLEALRRGSLFLPFPASRGHQHSLADSPIFHLKRQQYNIFLSQLKKKGKKRSLSFWSIILTVLELYWITLEFHLICISSQVHTGLIYFSTYLRDWKNLNRGQI